MLSLEYSKRRLAAFLKEIESIESSDFAYSDSKDCLLGIKRIFKDHLDAVSTLDKNSDPLTIQASIISPLKALFHFTPLLGFVLRSTNVRNSFEAYGPLLRLAKSILGKGIKLVLSSEWDYSPYNFRFPSLHDYVLIGLPAPESSNPLLVPLAGHELGHSIWPKFDLEQAFKRSLESSIQDQIEKKWDEYIKYFPDIDKATFRQDFLAAETWSLALDWSMRQAEEGFCDFIGLRIFREAYLHAFAYLLSPMPSNRRVRMYPSMKTRVANLMTAAKRYKIAPPNDYEALFIDNNFNQDNPTNSLLLSLADIASQSIADELIAIADKIISDAKIKEPSSAIYNSIETRFLAHPIPHPGPECIQNIMIAAWRVYHREDLWKSEHYHDDRYSVLNELVLKNFEILEYNYRTSS